MGCLSLDLHPVAAAELSVAAAPGADLGVTALGQAALGVTSSPEASLGVTPSPEASLGITPDAGLTLAVGEVCSVSGGAIVVFAGSDGPFRTKNGGYFLLNPATNPPEE
jgi:hypothetical protein